MAESEQMLFLSGVKWLKWRPERSSYLQTIVSIHIIAPHPWLFQWFFFIAWEIVSLRWWKWHPDHFYIQAMVSIRTSQFWSDRWHFFLFNQPKIFWNLREYASYLFQVGIFRSDPFVSPSTHQFEFISTFAPFPILPRRPIYFSSNNHQTSSHKSYLPTTPIIANWRRSGARKCVEVDAAPNHGCEKIRRRNKYDRKFVTNPLWPVPMDPWGLGVIK